jgi:hypothetical protein
MIWAKYLKDENGEADALDGTPALVVGGRRSFSFFAESTPRMKFNVRRNSKKTRAEFAMKEKYQPKVKGERNENASQQCRRTL